MLQQAVEGRLRELGWSVRSEGRVLIAEREGSGVILGFVHAGEARGFIDRCETSTASSAAILLEPVPDSEVVMMEEAGIVCFPRDDVEEFVVASLLRKAVAAGSDFARFLEGTYP